MKNIRYLIILLVVCFLTGCKVDYNININRDLSVDETVLASDYKKNIEVMTNLKGKEAVNYLFDIFKRGKKDEVFYYDEDSTTVKATVSNNYSSLDEYKTYSYSNMFDEVKVKENDGVITLTSKQIQKLGNDSSRPLLYDEVNVNIKVPYKVVSHNADKVHNDTYTWNFKKNEKLKTIKLLFKKNTNKNAISVGLKKNNININYSYIVIGFIVAIICVIIIVVTINNKKNNAL